MQKFLQCHHHQPNEINNDPQIGEQSVKLKCKYYERYAKIKKRCSVLSIRENWWYAASTI
jgi:hypothetical protein